MPTYDYVCTKCGNQFEAFQSMNDKPLTKCPKCKGRVKRLLGTGAGFVFKGGGFYETDFKTKKGSPAPTASETPTPKACEGCSKAKAADKK